MGLDCVLFVRKGDQMDKQDDVLAFFTLEEFIDHVGCDDGAVRLENFSRTESSGAQIGPLLRWWILVTARLDDHVAMFSVLVGETWQVFASHEPYHHENVLQACDLVRRYLEEQGLQVLPGMWNPKVCQDNLLRGSAGLWRFDEGGRLVEIEDVKRNA